METTIGERFRIIIEHLGLNKLSFANSIGKTSSAINTIVADKNKPGYDLLEAVFRKYPQINRDWLLLGEGEMLRPTEPNPRGGNYLSRYIEELEARVAEQSSTITDQSNTIRVLLGKSKRATNRPPQREAFQAIPLCMAAS